MARHVSEVYRRDWRINTRTDGIQIDFVEVQVVLLQEIREELKTLNRLLGCRNFLRVPTTLRAIDRELKTARKVKEAEKK